MSAYDIREAFERIELELIASMARNLKGHRDWELSEGFDWNMWQVEQLYSMQGFSAKYAELLPGQYARINDEIEKLIAASYRQGGLDAEIAILGAIKDGYNPRVNPMQVDSFFQVNEPKLQAIIAESMKDIPKAETAILRRVNDQYRKIIYDAQIYANTGAGTLYQAVDMATKDFLKQGINCIEYADGKRVNIASYAEMAVRTANKRAYISAEGEMRNRWGISLVEVMPNNGACKQCLPWVGQVLVDDVWSNGIPDGKHHLLSEAISQGLYHPNCRDTHSTYFGDEDELRSFEYTPELIAEDEARQAVESRQRVIAYDIQRNMRLQTGSLHSENKKKYAGVISNLKDAWNTQADEARKLGFLPVGFVAAGQAWDSIKRSVKSVLDSSGVNAGNVAKDLIIKAEAQDKVVTPLLESMQNERAKLSGLEFRIKSADSLRRKIETDMGLSSITVVEASAKMKDVLRYTYEIPTDNFIDEFFRLREQLERRGYNMVAVKNTLADESAIYRGVNTSMRAPGGYLFELQFHTPESLLVKQELNHELYEEARLPKTSSQRKRELVKRMREYSKLIPTPKGIENIR